MKRLFIVRHAKSSWENPSLKDYDRPLNQRGLRDAPFMGQFIAEKYESTDLIISSTANRAFTTATYFAEAFGIDKDDIQTEKSLYHAYEEEVYEVIANLDEEIKSAFIFGHNPTFTSIANNFSEDYIDNVPTCGIIVLESEAKTWTAVHKKNTKLIAFYYPKMFANK